MVILLYTEALSSFVKTTSSHKSKILKLILNSDQLTMLKYFYQIIHGKTEKSHDDAKYSEKKPVLAKSMKNLTPTPHKPFCK